jgi:multidrug efflux pump
MLATKILKSRKTGHGRFYMATERFFDNLNARYRNSLDKFLRHRQLTFLIMGLSVVLIVIFWKLIPSEMAPLEDSSQIMINLTMPEGASYEFTQDYNEEIARMVEEIVPEHELEGIQAMTRGTRSFVRALLVPPGSVNVPRMKLQGTTYRRSSRKKQGQWQGCCSNPLLGADGQVCRCSMYCRQPVLKS